MTKFQPTENVQDLEALSAHKRSALRNRAMRLEDRWQQFRFGLARRRGLDITVLSFAGYGTQQWVRVFSRVVMTRDAQFENGRRVAKVIADGVRGWRNFISAPVPFADVTVTVGGRTVSLTADRGGNVDAVIEVPLEPGWHQITLQTAGSEPTSAEVFVIADGTVTGVVCDIDDTVVVTKLPRPMLAAWNSFVLDEHARTPTPGMAVMMERLMMTYAGSPVLYISTGAWNVAQTLTRFLTRNLYPEGPLLLTDWGPTEDRWFRSGKAHKVEQLERLAGEFPGMRWILIGDDGQHDPTIYAEFARRYPDAVAAVIIRELTYSEAMLAGGRAEHPNRDAGGQATGWTDTGDVIQNVGERHIPWIYGPDGKDLVWKLEQHGLLRPARES